MTLEKILENGARYALNEITGEMVELNPLSKRRPYRALIPGDTSPLALCSLLFDGGQIAENWSPLSNREAYTRYARYGGKFFPEGLFDQQLLCGCITCQRL